MERSNRRGRGRGRRGRNNRNRKKYNDVTKESIKMSRIGRVVPLKYNFQPPRLENIIRYNDTVNVSVSAGGVVDQIFRLNNIWDPDLSGVGRVGYGYEQMQPLYSKYFVYKVKWIIEVPGSNDRMNYCVVPVNEQGTTTTAFTDINFPAELPFAKIGTTSYNGSVPFKDIRTRSIPPLMGVTFEQYCVDDRFVGTYNDTTGFPLEQCFLHIVFNNPTLVSHTTNLFVTIEYTTVSYDPKHPVPTVYKRIRKDEEEIVRKLSNINLENNIEENTKVGEDDIEKTINKN